MRVYKKREENEVGERGGTELRKDSSRDSQRRYMSALPMRLSVPKKKKIF